MRAFATACLCTVGFAALAQAPDTSLRPVARPEQQLAGVDPAVPGEVAIPEAPKVKRKGLFQSLRPLVRPKTIRREAAAIRELRAKGAVCGDPEIQGIPIGAVTGPLNGCGISDAVKITSVSGVALTQQSIMDCTTAKALNSWAENGMKPAVGNTGGGVVKIKVVAHYACRTRNNRKGAKLSEHAKGNAIDIAAFILRDGTEISVLKYWNNGRNGKILRNIHKSACGPFGTVLGPAADIYHRDHFHLDTARYRKGSYCR